MNIWKKISMTMLVLVLFILFVVPIVYAAPSKQAEPITLDSFLLWLVTGGSVVAVSWILEQMMWFQNLPSKSKLYVQFGLSALLGIVALAVQMYVPKPVLEAIAPFFAIVGSVFAMVFLNQMAHLVDSNRKE